MTEFQVLQQWARNCWLAGIPLAEANAVAGQPWRGMIDRLTEQQAIAMAEEQEGASLLLDLVAPAESLS